jgi:ribonuclease G
VYQDLHLIRRVVRDLFTADVSRFAIDSPEEYGRVSELLASFAPKLKPRLFLHRDAEPIFERFGVEKELDKALRRKVWLKSGGYVVIDRTEALTVIDVNTGKYVGKTDLASTIFRTNLEAIGEIVRQIALRDIGGIILVDFIDMENEQHRRKVMQALADAVRGDRSKIHIIDLTGLGLVEITRKRVYQDLEEVMRIPCPYCEGRGRVLSPETMALRVRRELRKHLRTTSAPALVVEVHPEVYAQLFRDGPGWLEALEAQTAHRAVVRGREGMHLERMAVLEVESVQMVEGEELPKPLTRSQVYWLDQEAAEPVTVGRNDDDEDIALAAGAAHGGLVGRLMRLLRRT